MNKKKVVAFIIIIILIVTGLIFWFRYNDKQNSAGALQLQPAGNIQQSRNGETFNDLLKKNSSSSSSASQEEIESTTKKLNEASKNKQ